MSKKTYRLIFTVLVVVILVVVVIVFSRRLAAPKDEAMEQAEINNGSTVIGGLPVGALPLVVKDKNQKVKAMQEALIKIGASIPAGATGYFGSQTQAALTFAGYPIDKIEQADYNDILALKKKVAKAGDSIEANKNNVQVYNEGLTPTAIKNKDQFIGTVIAVNPATNLVLFHGSGNINGYVYLNDIKVA